MMMEGASDKTVSKRRIWMLEDTSCGLEAGSTLKPNLNGKVVSANASALIKVIIDNTTAIFKPLSLLIISNFNPVFFDLVILICVNNRFKSVQVCPESNLFLLSFLSPGII